MCMMLPETPDSVREWARAKPPDEVVGYALAIFDCPLATYIREMTGVQVGVLPTALVEMPNYLELEGVPEWVTAFVWALDATHGGPITASELVTLLDELTALPDDVAEVLLP